MCTGSNNARPCACGNENSFEDKRFIAASIIGAFVLAALGIRLLVMVGAPVFIYVFSVVFIVPLGFCLFIASAGLVSLAMFTCQVIWHLIHPFLKMAIELFFWKHGSSPGSRKGTWIVKGGVLGCLGIFVLSHFQGSSIPSVPKTVQEASNLKLRYVSHLRKAEVQLTSLSHLTTDFGSSERSARGTNHEPEFLAILTQARATLAVVDELTGIHAAYESAIQTEASRLRTASDEMAIKAQNAESRDAQEGYSELAQVASRVATDWESELALATQQRELLYANCLYVHELVAFLEDAHRVMSVVSEVELPSESHMAGYLEQVKQLRTGVSRTLGILRELNSKMSGDILSSPPSEALEDNTT